MIKTAGGNDRGDDVRVRANGYPAARSIHWEAGRFVKFSLSVGGQDERGESLYTTDMHTASGLCKCSLRPDPGQILTGFS
jgi:hypothetical protein